MENSIIGGEGGVSEGHFPYLGGGGGPGPIMEFSMIF